MELWVDGRSAGFAAVQCLWSRVLFFFFVRPTEKYQKTQTHSVRVSVAFRLPTAGNKLPPGLVVESSPGAMVISDLQSWEFPSAICDRIYSLDPFSKGLGLPWLHKLFRCSVKIACKRDSRVLDASNKVKTTYPPKLIRQKYWPTMRNQIS